MVCLMAAGRPRGFAEALVSAEASVGAEAVVEADLGIGGRFKLVS
jgi:hypothetical protein